MLRPADIAADAAQSRFVIVKDLGDLFVGNSGFHFIRKLFPVESECTGDAWLGRQRNLHLGSFFLRKVKRIGRWLAEAPEQRLFLGGCFLSLSGFFDRCGSKIGIEGNGESFILRLFDQILQLLVRAKRLVIALAGIALVHQVFKQRREFKLVKEDAAGLIVRLLRAHGFDVKMNGHVLVDGDQFLAEQDHIAVVEERFAIGLLLDLCGVLKRSFDAAESSDQFD